MGNKPNTGKVRAGHSEKKGISRGSVEDAAAFAIRGSVRPPMKCLYDNDKIAIFSPNSTHVDGDIVCIREKDSSEGTRIGRIFRISKTVTALVQDSPRYLGTLMKTDEIETIAVLIEVRCEIPHGSAMKNLHRGKTWRQKHPGKMPIINAPEIAHHMEIDRRIDSYLTATMKARELVPKMVSETPKRTVRASLPTK